MLDFVPNHVALDHPWIYEYPECFITFPEDAIKDMPFLKEEGFIAETRIGKRWVMHGKDPNFPCWNDTAQLNWASFKTHELMTKELFSLATHCDGVRCDMAMLLQPETFYRTWGWCVGDCPWPGNFWETAIIKVKQKYPDFQFVGEAYWHHDELYNAGFNALYAKWFYDRLSDVSCGLFDTHGREEDKRVFARDIRFFLTDPYSAGQLVFLENHDEARSTVRFRDAIKPFMALILFFPYAKIMTHQGQFEGRTIKNPVQINREHHEDINQDLYVFYKNMFRIREKIKKMPESFLLREDHSVSPVFSCARVNKNEGVLLRVNLSHYPQSETIRLPDGYEIDERNEYRSELLSPWGVQLVFLRARR